MIRLTDVWFEFNGVKSTAHGLWIAAMPVRPHPAERGTLQKVAGRSGYLWTPENAQRVTYNNILIRIQCLAQDNTTIDDINAWLSGAGDLRFSDEPDRVYRARVTKEFSRSNRVPRFTAQEFTVTFDCQPYRYKYLSNATADDWTRASSGETITNPGTVESEPAIRIEGSGDVTLTIGTQQVDLTGLTDGIIVDSAWMDCYSLDRSELLNSLADMDEFPVLNVGANLVSWTGAVTSVTITPRWRYL